MAEAHARAEGGAGRATRQQLPDVRGTAKDRLDSPLFERIDARLNEKVVIDQNMNAASREQYRRLAAVLHDAQSTAGCRS